MVGRKMEGNEELRRKRAREARERGRLPSAAAGTKGASKQRHHLPRDEEHVEKVETIREGKHQAISQAVAEPKVRPRSRRRQRARS